MTNAPANPVEPTATSPPYIPWKSFIGYVAALKNTTVPHTLDGTVRPKSMAGGLWRQLTSALQFLGLINASKVTQEGLRKLVKAHGTAEWKKVVHDCVLPAYAKIVLDTPIENATPGQLEKRFRELGKVDGQMLQKSMRFYLHALKESGVKYSDHLAMRQQRMTGRKAAASRKKQKREDQSAATNGVSAAVENGGEPRGQKESECPAGLIEQRLFFRGKPTGLIRVPADLSEDDCRVVALTLEVLKAYAEQGKNATGQ